MNITYSSIVLFLVLIATLGCIDKPIREKANNSPIKEVEYDVSACENIGDWYSGWEKIDCYTNLAISHKQPGICDYIPKLTAKFNCYIAVAGNLSDSSVCEKIYDESDNDYLNYRDSCYTKIALEKQDVRPCEYVNDIYAKISCYKDISRESNSDVCSLVSSKKKDECYSYTRDYSCVEDSDCVIRTNKGLSINEYGLPLACHRQDPWCIAWEKHVFPPGPTGHTERLNPEYLRAYCSKGLCDLDYDCSKFNEDVSAELLSHYDCNDHCATTCFVCGFYYRCKKDPDICKNLDYSSADFCYSEVAKG